MTGFPSLVRVLMRHQRSVSVEFVFDQMSWHLTPNKDVLAATSEPIGSSVLFVKPFVGLVRPSSFLR